MKIIWDNTTIEGTPEELNTFMSLQAKESAEKAFAEACSIARSAAENFLTSRKPVSDN
ncbi:hypothetical protein [Brevibacillus laterosporus]|uniref:hypothetical protein n=1 Tax=Brevibacillus laterosporus TaxID=1465 RepID=UPI0015E2001C|nr:hypothetical protein [Brevibacillus laterosporus]MED1667102.1 hypothetical protein [Brevibacillus laterosporus]MED1671249.1 hypothetical protein [Brevibacillus laterosporus]MED1721053.1 hypothetical protein [Brevibacillus laterosporus]